MINKKYFILSELVYAFEQSLRPLTLLTNKIIFLIIVQLYQTRKNQNILKDFLSMSRQTQLKTKMFPDFSYCPIFVISY